MSRIKTKVSKLTRQEIEAVVGKIAMMTIQRDQQMATMDEEIANVRKQFEDSISGVSGQIDESFSLVREWAEAHPEEFKDRKSIDMVHGTIGFRTGMPSLKTLRGITWEKVLLKINEMGLLPYIRTRYDVDKEKMLADRAEAIGSLFGQIGVQVKQDESFYVEPKRETIPEQSETAANGGSNGR